MPKGWAALSRNVRWLVAGVVAVVLGLAVIWVLFVPAADWLAHHDVGSATGALHETAVDNARGRLLTLGAGLLAAAALVFTALNFNLLRRNSEQTDEWQRRTHELTEQGQVTDRYTKAIEQLGSDRVDVRIGGIYALERIARDSARDHPTVIEVLIAFIREHCREPWPLADSGGPEQQRSTRPDVQAAVTVIGRRDRGRDIPGRLIFLHGVALVGANLVGSDLTSAVLMGADLTGATLIGAVLDGALLTEANLTNANLTDAHGRAILFRANLTSANLFNAHLADADLIEADLTNARLGNADLIGADLTGADLTGADLKAADLTGADLTDARLGGANLAFVDLTDATWPANEPVPESWTLDPGSRRLKRGLSS
jgi:Pentapeptide repeats (8 copies)